MIFLSMSMIGWLTKKYAAVEGDVVGADFVAIKYNVEVLCGSSYKLRMMGVDIEGPTYIYGDNMSVIHNTSNLKLS